MRRGGGEEPQAVERDGTLGVHREQLDPGIVLQDLEVVPQGEVHSGCPPRSRSRGLRPAACSSCDRERAAARDQRHRLGVAAWERELVLGDEQRVHPSGTRAHAQSSCRRSRPDAPVRRARACERRPHAAHQRRALSGAPRGRRRDQDDALGARAVGGGRDRVGRLRGRQREHQQVRALGERVEARQRSARRRSAAAGLTTVMRSAGNPSRSRFWRMMRHGLCPSRTPRRARPCAARAAGAPWRAGAPPPPRSAERPSFAARRAPPGGRPRSRTGDLEFASASGANCPASHRSAPPPRPARHREARRLPRTVRSPGAPRAPPPARTRPRRIA